MRRSLENVESICYFISVHLSRKHRKFYREIMLSSFAYFIVRYNITALLSWYSEIYDVLLLLKLGNAIQISSYIYFCFILTIGVKNYLFFISHSTYYLKLN